MPTITVNADQMPVTQPTERVLRWNCDEYCIAYDKRTKVLTVEDFEGFTDEGGEITTPITDPARVDAILSKYKPGWPGLDGFTLLKDYYGAGWTIGTEPI